MKKLILELPDVEYDMILREFAANHQTPAEYIITNRLKTLAPNPALERLSEKEREDAWAVLMSHAGSVNSGDPHSSDNERIDADLAREYGNNHEDEA